MESSPAQSAPAETSKPEERSLPKKPASRAKRPRGTGSVFKPRGGKFFYIAYYPVSSGGFQKTESSGSTLKMVAQEMLRDRLEKIRQGLYCETPPRKITFQVLADDLLNDYRINRRHTIKDAESRIENHLQPFFGNYLAAAITTEKAREYLLLRREEGAADGTIQQELSLLKRAFRLASRATPPKVARVPYIQMPRCDNVRKGFIEHEGYTQLLAALPEYLRPVVTMAYHTGMRLGEIVSLRWENVELLNRLVRLNAGETKNGDGRVIPLGDELLESLKSQLHLRNTAVPHCPLVFFRIIKTKENPSPSWVPIGDFRKVWETACAKCGLAGRIFHDLRRSAVRNLVRAGVQERVAMRISGHKTRSVFDRYNIIDESDLKLAVRKLQKFQDAAEPGCQPAPAEARVSTAKSAFVN
jgi:integrase